MKRFKILSGRHYVSPGVFKSKGEEVASKRDLKTLFPNKFEYVGEGEAVAVAERPPETAKKEVADEPDQPEIKEDGALGVDVTSGFKLARKNGLRVFKGDAGFSVVERDDEETPLNIKPIKTSKRVEGFIRRHIDKE